MGQGKCAGLLGSGIATRQSPGPQMPGSPSPPTGCSMTGHGVKEGRRTLSMCVGQTRGWLHDIKGVWAVGAGGGGGCAWWLAVHGIRS